MTILYDIPTDNRVCRAFAAVAVQTWGDLSDFPALAEQSITDYQILTLKRLCPDEVRAEKFTRHAEGAGAYWEWWFGAGDHWFGMLVQAEKLDPASLRYENIDCHPGGGTNPLRVERLLAESESRNLTPLYCFYNRWPENDMQFSRRCSTFSASPECWGTSFAHARRVFDRVREGRKHLADYGDIMLPLNCLTSCREHAHLGGPGNSLPFRARGVVVSLGGPVEATDEMLGVGDIVQHPPDYVTAILDDRPNPEVERPNLDGVLVVKEDPRIYARTHQDAPRPRKSVAVPHVVTVPPTETITDSWGMRFARIPAGAFQMGSCDDDENAGKREKPRHSVRITKPFCLGVYPVTQGEYEAVMGENPSRFRGDDRRPVECISWFQAVQFCNRLSEQVGREPYYKFDRGHVSVRGGEGYRLPSEAEWEYACRAGTATKWYCGDYEHNLMRVAWYLKNSDNTTHPVDEKEPIAWGLHDLHGNVWEWCGDRWPRKYKADEAVDPIGPSGAAYRPIRGGCWSLDAMRCRSAFRHRFGPWFQYCKVGFRVAYSFMGNGNEEIRDRRAALHER